MRDALLIRTTNNSRRKSPLLGRLFLPLILTATSFLGLQNGATISGTVRLPDGGPAAGVRVAAMAVPAPGTDPSASSALVAITETDDTGRYRLEDVLPGSYYVVAGRVNALTFYPGGTQETLATPLVIAAGAEVSGIDFTVAQQSLQQEDAPFGRNPFFLQPLNLTASFPPQVQIRGRVVLAENSRGAALPDVIVVSVKSSAGPTIRTDGTPTIFLSSRSATRRIQVAADGTFVFDAPQGEATISLQYLPPGYKMESIRAGSTDLTAASFNVQQSAPEIGIVVSADLRPRYHILGKVISDKTLIGRQIELLSESGTVIRLLLEPGGNFIFRNLLPGTYSLRQEELDIRQSVRVTDSNVTVELAEAR